MKNLFLGIDNGVTGSIAWINNKRESNIFKTPIKVQFSYTKKRQKIARLDYIFIYRKFAELKDKYNKIFCYLERPMINPVRFKASISAARSLESILIIIEELNFSYEYVDSKFWQKCILPSGLKGSSDLKAASREIGIRLFPEHINEINKIKDADSILMTKVMMEKSS